MTVELRAILQGAEAIFRAEGAREVGQVFKSYRERNVGY
jgi:hypothetical protein